MVSQMPEVRSRSVSRSIKLAVIFMGVAPGALREVNASASPWGVGLMPALRATNGGDI
jgi:hypothetical protein